MEVSSPDVYGSVYEKFARNNLAFEKHRRGGNHKHSVVRGLTPNEPNIRVLCYHYIVYNCDML